MTTNTNTPTPAHSAIVEEQPLPEGYSELAARFRELEERLATSNEIRAELVKEKTALEMRVESAQRALMNFQDEVIELAMEEAMDRDWCDEIEHLLRDRLGLELPDRRAYASVEVTLRVEARSGARPVFTRNDPDSHIEVIALGDGRFDLDCSGGDIEVVDVQIDGVDYGEWTEI